MRTLRSNKTQSLYDAHRAGLEADGDCELCSKDILKEFKHWNIVQNLFPYDILATVHHMIIPKGHVRELDLDFDELKELIEIKSTYINEGYDLILHQVTKDQSIPDHFHLHLIVGKEDFNTN